MQRGGQGRPGRHALDHAGQGRESPAARCRRKRSRLRLLEVTIKTGRTHQIRVHLASAGHPIAGDDKYGDFELQQGLARSRASSACSCMRGGYSSIIPATGERVALQAALPPELQH